MADHDLVDGLQKVIETLENLGIASGPMMKGCSKEQVGEIERYAGFELPASYRLFLERMGVYAGQFFHGTDVFFPTMIGMKEAAEELLEIGAEEMDARVTLPDNSFVFAMHQGYQFFFFVKDEDCNPVYHYMEGNQEITKWSDSFIGFLDYMARVEW